MSGTFRDNEFYVALSRCRHLDDVKICSFLLYNIRCDTECKNFYLRETSTTTAMENPSYLLNYPSLGEAATESKTISKWRTLAK